MRKYLFLLHFFGGVENRVKKREIYQFFPGCRIKLWRTTLAPPIARVLAPHSWLACYLLEKIPLLCTHYLGVIQKG